MKKLLIFSLISIAIGLAGCNSATKEAKKIYENAVASYESGNYAKVRILTDSLKNAFPKEVKVRRDALELLRKVEYKEAENNIAFCDSLLPIKLQEAELLKKDFTFEKNEEYEKLGNYIPKGYSIEQRTQRSYLRVRVDESGKIHLESVYYGSKPLKHTHIRLSIKDLYAETPEVPYDGGRNYRFKDRGMTTEVVTYSEENAQEVINFINNHNNQKLTLTYLGEGKPYSMTLSTKELDVIRKTFTLGACITDIETMKAQIIQSQQRIEYLNKKLNTETNKK